MPAKPHLFPEVIVPMISFDMMPRKAEGVVRMVHYDISRMKRATKQKNAVSASNASRVFKSEKQVRVEFLDTNQPEEKQIKLRFIYELMPPFRSA